MRSMKKKVFLAAVAISLVAIISMGTLAWFQAEDSVENIFQVSTESGSTTPDFDIELFEHKADSTGRLSNEEVDENTYLAIAPGANLYKDPTVRNTGKYDQWVRIKITLPEYAAWEAALGADYDFSVILKNVSSEWTLDNDTVGTDTLVYYKNTKLAPNGTSNLFTGVEIPSGFAVENMPATFNLNLVAEAIQYENTGATAQAAFTNWN